ncbi:MAG: hypothetical protein KKI06_07545 [Euryarchaeota archaeon]|nr:hypothetical protein [Euryarchaeota archaeon]
MGAVVAGGVGLWLKYLIVAANNARKWGLGIAERRGVAGINILHILTQSRRNYRKPWQLIKKTADESAQRTQRKTTSLCALSALTLSYAAHDDSALLQKPQ